MKKITKDVLKSLAEIYNQHGKKEMYNQLRTVYEIKNPTSVYTRMKKDETLGYNSELNKFTFHHPIGDDVFISFEELCSPSQKRMTVSTQSTESCKSDAMERLIQELIGSKLLEMSKYITMSVSERTVIIDQTSLKNDGYRIIAH